MAFCALMGQRSLWVIPSTSSHGSMHTSAVCQTSPPPRSAVSAPAFMTGLLIMDVTCLLYNRAVTNDYLQCE